MLKPSLSFPFRELFLNRRKIFLPNSTERANPILRKGFKRSSRLDSAFRIAYFSVIYIPANITFVFLHNRVF